jgi:hypothetical protein
VLVATTPKGFGGINWTYRGQSAKRFAIEKSCGGAAGLCILKLTIVAGLFRQLRFHQFRSRRR